MGFMKCPLRRLGVGLLLATLLLFPEAASTQSAVSIELSLPDTSAFPRIQAFVEIRDGNGEPFREVNAEDLRLFENGLSITDFSVVQEHPGIQLVISINPGSAFAIRNAQGLSRYDLAAQSLQGWLRRRQGSTVDDLSLVVNGGSAVSHTPWPRDLIAALNEQPPDLRNARPDLDSLFKAVELAADPSPRPGMKRVVLFITAPLDIPSDTALQNLSAQVQQGNVRIYSWIIASAGSVSPQALAPFNDLITQSGGEMIFFSGGEMLPDIENVLAPLRSLYRITYHSLIKMSGRHQIEIELQTADGVIKSGIQEFDVPVAPPNPAFISPPLTIDLNPPVAVDSQPAKSPSQLHQKQELMILVEFPDGHPRPLRRTTLYVDSQVAAENLQPPFDRFEWDLSGIAQSGVRRLRVEAEDTLGTVGSSMDIYVDVVLYNPAPSTMGKLPVSLPLLIGISILTGGVILATFFFLRSPGRVYPLKGKTPPPPIDPKPMALASADTPAHTMSKWIVKLQGSARRTQPKADAFLTRITTGEETTQNSPIPILDEELPIGSDAEMANLVIGDNSVAPLHARLRRTPSGAFLLQDERSTAGTWVNYAPVTESGVFLEHGDLIWIGRQYFLFSLRTPLKIMRPVVAPLEKTDGTFGQARWG